MKITSSSKMYKITEDAIKNEINQLNVGEEEKRKYIERAEKLPRGILKIELYRRDLKALLVDLYNKGADINRINKEIKEHTGDK